MLLPESLETERLLLRPVLEGDLEFFVGLHGNRDVVRYLGSDGTPRTPEVTRAWLTKMRRWYREEHIGPYAIVRRQDGVLVGRSGMSFFEFERTPSTASGIPLATWGKDSMPGGREVERNVEVGYVIHPDFQGHGYATEAAARWVRFALEERGEPHVISIIHLDNLPSLRVAEKNGLERDGDVHMEGRDYAVFRKLRGSQAPRESRRPPRRT